MWPVSREINLNYIKIESYRYSSVFGCPVSCYLLDGHFNFENNFTCLSNTVVKMKVASVQLVRVLSIFSLLLLLVTNYVGTFKLVIVL